MIILVVGPSSAGKSTLCRYVSDKLAYVKCIDLDQEIAKQSGHISANEYRQKEGSEAFLVLSKKIINSTAVQFQNLDRICLLVIGAGTLDAGLSIEIIKKHMTLLINADKQKAYGLNRNMLPERSFDEYVSVEYIQHREIYESTAYCFRNDYSSKSKNDFVLFLQKVINLTNSKLYL